VLAHHTQRAHVRAHLHLRHIDADDRAAGVSNAEGKVVIRRGLGYRLLGA
jgi:hypothetical protein